MANLFGILTAIILALSALVAYKNKEAFTDNTSKNQEQKVLLTKNQSNLKAAQALADSLPAELAALEPEIAALVASEVATSKANEALKAKIEPLTAKISSNKEKLDGIREKTSKMGDLKELSSKMRATNAELEELTQLIATAEAKLANLTSQATAAEGEVASGKGKIDSSGSNESLITLNSRIRSLYPNWGFVTLTSGNNAGVVTNSTLNVVRNGETVAKLLVTAVESGTSSASIVPDSMKGDVTLRVGDRVVAGQAADKRSSN